MLKLRMGLSLLASLAFAGPSQAAVGTVYMAWDNCAGPIDKTDVPGSYSLFLSVAGHDEGHKGYDVRFVYGNGSQEVPDAWRFDEAGCQGSTLISQDITAKAACPPFHQNAGHPLQIRKVEFSPPFDPYATTMMRVLLANVYDEVTAVDPGTRYLLERVLFNLSFAVQGEGTPGVSCGGFEQPMCFQLSYASVLDLNNIEKVFNRAEPQLSVSFNGASACPRAVPARPTTWGSIKSQYRL